MGKLNVHLLLLIVYKLLDSCAGQEGEQGGEERQEEVLVKIDPGVREPPDCQRTYRNLRVRQIWVVRKETKNIVHIRTYIDIAFTYKYTYTISVISYLYRCIPYINL